MNKTLERFIVESERFLTEEFPLSPLDELIALSRFLCSGAN